MGAGDPRRGRRAGAVSYLDPDLLGVVSAETLIDLMIAILTLGDRP